MILFRIVLPAQGRHLTPDKKQLRYREKISKYLKDIKSKNLKEYWKLISLTKIKLPRLIGKRF